jgi:hypothetical protein
MNTNIVEKLIGLLFFCGLLVATFAFVYYQNSNTKSPEEVWVDGLNDDNVFDYYTDEELLEAGTLGGILEVNTLPQINDDESDEPIDDHLILRVMELLSGENMRK